MVRGLFFIVFCLNSCVVTCGVHAFLCSPVAMWSLCIDGEHVALADVSYMCILFLFFIYNFSHCTLVRKGFCIECQFIIMLVTRWNHKKDAWKCEKKQCIKTLTLCLCPCMRTVTFHSRCSGSARQSPRPDPAPFPPMICETFLIWDDYWLPHVSRTSSGQVVSKGKCR